MNGNTSARPLAVTIALSVLALSACAGKSAPSAAPSASSAPPAATAPSSVEPSTTVAASPTGPTVDQTIRITYAAGKVSGVSAVVKVKKNNTVALVVTSDTADEIHLHGYDKHVDVTKGGTATLVFKATLEGKWEVELEKLKHRLVFVQVQ